MFSAKTRMKAIAMAGAAFGLGLAGAAQAGVVVASSGPSASQYPKGKKLEDNDRIVLKDGDSVTILDSKGTRVLSGPGTRVVGARGAPNRAKFAMLTRQRSATRARTGAVRGGDGTTLTNSNIWNVDTSISGTMCLADPSLVRLWRPTKDGVATYSITAPSGGTVNVLFDEGDTDAPWDTQLLPLSEEVEYTIRGPGGVPESKVSFIVLETPPNEPEELAAVLIDKGCTSQLDLLASTLAMPQG